MEEKKITKMLRRRFSGVGWTLLCYYGIVNLLVIVALVLDLARQGLMSLNGGGVWNPERSKAISGYTTFKGEIVLRDADKPDKKGIMRKVNRFYLTVYAHRDSENVMVKDVKLNLMPGQ